MRRILKSLAPSFGFLFLISATTACAQKDSSSEKMISGKPLSVFAPGKISGRSYILPATLIGFGTVATIIREQNNDQQHGSGNTPAKEPGILLEPENYTALAPAAAVAALHIFGVKGKHRPAEAALLYAMSAGISSAIVYPLKNNINIMRPDQTDAHSFPSGHAAIAFVSAEFLRREYGAQSPWYTIGGYAAATATAALRVAKNRHWFADVCAGAGIGMASTTTAYWIYNKIKKTSPKEKRATSFILPAVADGFYGIYLVKIF